MVHQNSNFYDSTVSKVKAILNTVQACSEPELEGIFNTKLSVLIGEIQELVIEIFGNDSSFTGEYVSLSVPVDRRQKCKRIKSESEPQRPTKQLYRGGTNPSSAFSFIAYQYRRQRALTIALNFVSAKDIGEFCPTRCHQSPNSKSRS